MAPPSPPCPSPNGWPPTLYYIAEYSQSEVAAFLGVPVTTVKKRLFAARRRLKERMLTMVEDTLHQQRPSREDRFALTVQALAAVKKGDAGALDALLRRDPALVDAVEDGQPLLFVAGMYGYGGRTRRYAPVVDLLKAHGAGRTSSRPAYLDERRVLRRCCRPIPAWRGPPTPPG